MFFSPPKEESPVKCGYTDEPGGQHAKQRQDRYAEIPKVWSPESKRQKQGIEWVTRVRVNGADGNGLTAVKGNA